MTISERFKQELQLGNFEQAIDLAIEEVLTLEIVTWVADDTEDDSDAAVRRPGHQICTKINLLDGKVENRIGKLFLDGEPYANLRSFHLEQVEASKALIEKKVASLQLLKEAWLDQNHQQNLMQRGWDRTNVSSPAIAPSKTTPSLEQNVSNGEPPSHEIEFILGNLFSLPDPASVSSSLAPEQSQPKSPENTNRSERPAASFDAIGEVNTRQPELVNLQIDLSLDDLLADLFTNDGEHEPPLLDVPDEANLPDHPALSALSDVWDDGASQHSNGTVESSSERS